MDTRVVFSAETKMGMCCHRCVGFEVHMHSVLYGRTMGSQNREEWAVSFTIKCLFMILVVSLCTMSDIAVLPSMS